MELYPLLPRIVRQMDAQASQQDGMSTDETFWQKVLSSYEAEATDLAALVVALRDLMTASECPEALLPRLARFLGAVLDSGWDVDSKRLVLQSTVHLFQCSGQRLSWTAYLNLLSYPEAGPVELWKEVIHETFNYSDNEYESLPYHAARIQVRRPDGSSVFLSDSERDVLDNFRPIHVRHASEGARVLQENSAVAAPISDGMAAQAGMSIDESLTLAADDGLLITLMCVRQCEIGYG